MREISVNIKLAKNGVVVNCYKPSDSSKGMGKDETYVYETVEEALKELPSILSVAKENYSDSKHDGGDSPEED